MDSKFFTSRCFHYLTWCAVLGFTWAAVRYWAEVRALGFHGVHAVKAVCATFIAITGWFDVLVMAKWRDKLG